MADMFIFKRQDPREQINLEELNDESVITKNIHIIAYSLNDYFAGFFTEDFDKLIEEKERPFSFDSDNDLFDFIHDFFSYVIIGLCECGCCDETRKVICNYLDIINDRTKETSISDKAGDVDWNKYYERSKNLIGYRVPTDNPLYQYLAYTLDDKDITDHGHNIDGAWITYLGEAYLYILKLYFKLKYNRGDI